MQHSKFLDFFLIFIHKLLLEVKVICNAKQYDAKYGFECNLEKNARVSFFKRLSKLHKSEGWVQFEVFEKLTSVRVFFKLHEKPYYYLLIIYMKKLCSHVPKSHLEIKKLRKFRNLKTKKLRKLKKFAMYFIFWHCISKTLHCS